MMPTIALIVFVKTPGLSAIKTRLAATIGQVHSEQFYLLSIHATRSVIHVLQQEHPYFKFYWAIAEREGMNAPLWASEVKILQGPGNLGERLARIYTHTIKKYDQVYCIGADSPHLTPTIFKTCESQFKAGTDFVLGPAEDGGFYLFAGKTDLPATVWTNISYSTHSTCEQLSAQLCHYGKLSYLPSSFDIDEYADLEKLCRLDQRLLLPEQINLIHWITKELL